LAARNSARRLAGLLALGCLLCLVASTRGHAGAVVPLPRPRALEPNVRFWVDVFTHYSERDFIIHDRDDVTRVYQVLHLPGYGVPSQEDVESTNEYLKTKYTEILNRLAATQKPSDFEEVAVAALFKGQPHPDYLAAAQNLRVQQGMSEEFRASLVRARFYLPTIVPIFKSFGLPEELALLPTVESGFRPYARSKAGAVGLWQFTTATARQYLSVNRWHDERLNPTLATQAAARLLAHNHDMLGDWPLAITAYDYGTMGMVQAVEATNGGNLADILKSYSGPHFGFASKNYYAELLAAVQVWENREKYFPGIDLEPPEDEMPPPPLPVRHARVLYLHHGSPVRAVAYRASHRRIVMSRRRSHRVTSHHKRYLKRLREA
jgi:membrane-bound lytic murein transglycosylase D